MPVCVYCLLVCCSSLLAVSRSAHSNTWLWCLSGVYDLVYTCTHRDGFKACPREPRLAMHNVLLISCTYTSCSGSMDWLAIARSLLELCLTLVAIPSVTWPRLDSANLQSNAG
eukprot:scpid39569/ scgid21824/ 